jgi:hypothetical protein
VESKWKNYNIITFPGQSLSTNRETQFGRGYGPVARQTNGRRELNRKRNELGPKRDKIIEGCIK